MISRNSDWFIALFAPVVIGRSNYSDVGFPTVNSKPLYLHINLTDSMESTTGSLKFLEYFTLSLLSGYKTLI